MINGTIVPIYPDKIISNHGFRTNDLIKLFPAHKTQLCAEAGITTNAMARLGRDEDVRVEVLVKICSALNCTMDDIMEIIPDHDIQQRRLRE